jgi:hypothetical protein
LNLVSARVSGRDVDVGDELIEDRALEALLRNCLADDAARRPAAAAVERLAASRHATDRVSDETSRWGRYWRAIRKRRMPEWVGSTAAFALVMMEIVDQLTGNSLLPAYAYRVTVVTALAMIPGAAILAWFHGERGGQRFTALEIALLCILTASWLIALLSFAI